MPDTLKALRDVCGVELYKEAKARGREWEAGRPEKQVQVRGDGGGSGRRTEERGVAKSA